LPPQVGAQLIVSPQLFFTTTPHWVPQAAALSGAQQVPSLWQI
jgi:hypothetical protein